MIRGKTNLIEYFKICGYPYWTIYSYSNSKSGNPIAKSPEDDSYSLEQSEEDLTKTLNIIATGNTYLITLKKAQSLTKGYTETKYDHFDESYTTVNNNKDKIGFTEISDFQKQVEELSEKKANEKLEKHVKKQELEMLQSQIEELKKEVKQKRSGKFEDFIMNFIEKNPVVLQAITTLISPGKKVGIAGFDNSESSNKTNMNGENENKIMERQQQILEHSPKIWSESDPDFLKVLQKIAKLSSEKPEVYNKYKPFLLG